MSTVEQLERFTSRADYYARSRPGYPDDVIRILEAGAGWRPSSIIADIGAGTGISSELFLRHGNEVWAVEPNADMRAARGPDEDTIYALSPFGRHCGVHPPPGCFDRHGGCRHRVSLVRCGTNSPGIPADPEARRLCPAAVERAAFRLVAFLARVRRPVATLWHGLQETGLRTEKPGSSTGRLLWRAVPNAAPGEPAAARLQRGARAPAVGFLLAAAGRAESR